MFLRQIYQDPKDFQEHPGEKKRIQIVLEYDQIFSGNECVFTTDFIIKRRLMICFKCSICLKYILIRCFHNKQHMNIQIFFSTISTIHYFIYYFIGTILVLLTLFSMY